MNKENSGVRYTAFICFGLIAVILGTFFVAAFSSEQPERQKEISVILYYAGSGSWESLQEGMKRAEDDLSVNINYVMLREDAAGAEQFAAIEKEVANGAEGVIVAVEDYNNLYQLWLQKAFNVPIVTVESGFDESTIPLISADNYEMGKMLGEEILADFPAGKELTVALASEDIWRDSVEKREQGLRDALMGKATIIPLYEAVNGEEVDAVAALHKEAVLSMAEREEVNISKAKKYGIGNTASVVAALEQGRLEKLVFQNEFNMGYLAVQALLDEMGNVGSGETGNIDYYCVSRNELYSKPYEQLLFPIVE